MLTGKVSICVATYNMKEFLWELVGSILAQTYKKIEIIIYDDCSTDGTDKIEWFKGIKHLKYIRGEQNVGVGEAFNRAIKAATGEYIMLMCADDYLPLKSVIKDVVTCFEAHPSIGHVTRWYYQFLTDKNLKEYPVRAWRTYDPLTQANNPSGLAFRAKALKGCLCSNRMFIETTYLVSQVLKKGWQWRIIPYDTVAVRVHASTSTKPGYFLKRRVSSPVMDWYECGGDMTKDYVSLIQIKTGSYMKHVWEEIFNFIKLRPRNLRHPGFWFFAILAVITPRPVLRLFPDMYRRTWGRWTTRKITKYG